MRDFVPDSLLDTGTYLIIGFASVENRSAINADLVGRDQSVIMRSLCKWDAMIKAEQIKRIVHFSKSTRLSICLFFNNKSNVRNVATQFRR